MVATDRLDFEIWQVPPKGEYLATISKYHPALGVVASF
jgi:hypothetical protein